MPVKIPSDDDARIRSSGAGSGCGSGIANTTRRRRSPLHVALVFSAGLLQVSAAAGAGAAPAVSSSPWQSRARDAAFAGGAATSASAFQHPASSGSGAARLICAPAPGYGADELLCSLSISASSGSSGGRILPPTSTSLSATLEERDLEYLERDNDSRRPPDVELASSTHSDDDEILQRHPHLHRNGHSNNHNGHNGHSKNNNGHLEPLELVPKRNGHKIQFGYDQLAEAAFVPRPQGPPDAAAPSPPIDDDSIIGPDAPIDIDEARHAEDDEAPAHPHDALDDMQHLHDVRSERERMEAEEAVPAVAKTLRALWGRRPRRGAGGLNDGSLEDSSGANVTSIAEDKDEDKDKGGGNNRKKTTPPRSKWRRRHARSIEEGIRGTGDGHAVTPPTTRRRSDRRTYRTARELSSLLRDASTGLDVTGRGRSLKRFLRRRRRNMMGGGAGGETSAAANANANATAAAKREKPRRRRYAARTIAGLIVALTEESADLEVEVDARDDTPLWAKRVDMLKVNFSRLGFAQLRMGGLDAVFRDLARGAEEEEELAEEGLKEGLITAEGQLSPDVVETVVDVLGSSGSSDSSAAASSGGFGLLGGEVDMMEEDSERHREDLVSADEAFDRIDADNSGALDEEELAAALRFAAGAAATAERGASASGGGNSSLGSLEGDQTHPLVATKSREVMAGLAGRLVRLYDTNGDGVVDRAEYRSMVRDMAALRRAKRRKKREKEEALAALAAEEAEAMSGGDGGGSGGVGSTLTGWRRVVGKAISRGMHTIGLGDGPVEEELEEEEQLPLGNVAVLEDESGALDLVKEKSGFAPQRPSSSGLGGTSVVENVSASSVGNAATYAGEGSIVLSDLKLDLRRLLFGAVPWVKKITPGGPLILEPFTATVTASLKPDDIMNSILIDNGLRRLVARLLSRRVRSFRDLVDGAVFYGRTWNVNAKGAPQVEIPKIENVEFDEQDRMIISGRARIRAGPDAPVIENAFKLRTKLGTRGGGRYIRLKDPELALIVECPKPWERNIVSACTKLNLPVPRRPQPVYAYFPLVSPLKQTEQDGFNLGEDNCIQSIETKAGALRIEMSAVIRPGRFLGNHYLAFTIPNKTLIITLDKVKEGMRVARKNKLKVERAREREFEEAKRRSAEAYGRASAVALSDRVLPPSAKAGASTASSSSSQGQGKSGGGAAADDDDAEEESKSKVSSGPKSYTPLGDVLGSKLAPVDTGEYQFSEAGDIISSLPSSVAKLEDTQKKKEEKKKPGFFGKFVEGYLGAGKDGAADKTKQKGRRGKKEEEENEEEANERLMSAISEWFGMQDPKDWDDDDEHPAWRTV